MEKTKKDSQKELQKVGRTAIFSIIAVAIILFVVMTRAGINYTAMVEQNKERLTYLEDAIHEEEERTEQIDQLRAYMQSDEYQRMQARSRLGMVTENEIIFEEE